MNYNIKIFLVDDDPFSLEIFKQQLMNLGYHNVQAFEDADNCINQLRQQPSLIFLDYQMYPMDGLALLKKIKGYDPSIITVFISGQEEIDVAINALKFGAFDYLIKGDGIDVRINTVMEKIKQLMAEIEAPHI